MHTNTVQQRIESLLYVPLELLERSKEILQGLGSDAEKEEFVTKLEEFNAVLERSYAVDDKYIQDQEHLLTSLEQSAKKLERKEKEISQDSEDQSNLQSILPQLS